MSKLIFKKKTDEFCVSSLLYSYKDLIDFTSYQNYKDKNVKSYKYHHYKYAPNCIFLLRFGLINLWCFSPLLEYELHILIYHTMSHSLYQIWF